MKYKLVPVEPTREMWAAAGDAVVALNSQHHDAISSAVYKAMLAAAPDFDRHVIAEVNLDGDGYWADILRGQSVHLGQPLYGVMQPAPDVSKLVEALEKCRETINPSQQNCSCHISPPCADCVDYGFERDLADEIDAVLDTYRKQGGDA